MSKKKSVTVYLDGKMRVVPITVDLPHVTPTVLEVLRETGWAR